MNCDEYLLLLSGHLDGYNTEEEESRLQAHLQTCRVCRERLAQMEQDDALLADLPAPPPDLTKKIMGKIEKEKKQTKRRRFLHWAAPAGAAAAVLCLVFLGRGFGTAFSTSKTAEAVPTAADWSQLELEEAQVPNETDEIAECAPLPDGAYTGAADEGVDAIPGATAASSEKSYSFRSLPNGTVFPQSFLLIWKGEAQDFQELSTLEPLEAQTLSSEERAEYQRLLDALSQAYPDLFSGSDGTWTISGYKITYDLLTQLKETYSQQFEMLIYAPGDPNSQDVCYLLLAQEK